MATKFWVSLAALLFLYISFADGSIYRTNINGGNQACPRIRLQLEPCRRYVEGGRSGLFLMSESNLGRPYRCCDELDRAGSDECQCRALWEVARDSEQDEYVAAQRAQELAEMCGLRRCNIRGGLY